VSKDSNCSLVSNKNFSEILPSKSWRPGPGEVGQKVLHLWCHSQKNPQPPSKKLFWMQTTRLAASFHFDQVHNPYRSGDIPTQSHVQSSCFFCKPLELNLDVKVLTLWEPAYEYIVPRFQPKTISFRLPCQHPSSSTNCARELCKRLTLWEPAYDIFVLQFWPKKKQFSVALPLP